MTYYPRLHSIDATGHSPSESADDECERLLSENRALANAVGEAARLLEVARRTEELHRDRIAELEARLAQAEERLRRLS